MKIFKTLFILTISLIMVSACSDQSAEHNTVLENQLKVFSDSVHVATTSLIPGFIIQVKAPDQKVDWTYSAGTGVVGQEKIITPSMLFRIGSISKTFIVTMILQLCDEGLISLDNPLSLYLPSFPNSGQITIRQLCQMRSGVIDFTETNEYTEMINNHPEEGPSNVQLLEIIDQYPLNFSPGTQYEYSNSNTVLLAEILKIVTNQSVEENFLFRITNRAKIVHTIIPGNREFLMDYIHGYGDIDGSMTDVSKKYHPALFSYAGNMISNLNDISYWTRLMVQGGLTSSSIHQERMAVLETGEATRYGLGIMEMYGFYGHSGGVPGYISLTCYNPEKNCTITLFYNGYSEISKYYLWAHFVRAIQILYPDIPIDMKKNKYPDIFK